MSTVYYGCLNFDLMFEWFNADFELIWFGDAGLLLGLVCLFVCFNSVVYFIICSFGGYFCYLLV